MDLLFASESEPIAVCLGLRPLCISPSRFDYGSPQYGGKLCGIATAHRLGFRYLRDILIRLGPEATPLALDANSHEVQHA